MYELKAIVPVSAFMRINSSLNLKRCNSLVNFDIIDLLRNKFIHIIFLQNLIYTTKFFIRQVSPKYLVFLIIIL
jgi:hypothetical protein